MAAFRALRVIGKRGGIGRSDALEPPFVGRETEFRLLRELFHATGRERKARLVSSRLVSVTGQGGIGKSRLAWEFSKYTDGVVETILWHQGRSPSYGEPPGRRRPGGSRVARGAVAAPSAAVTRRRP